MASNSIDLKNKVIINVDEFLEKYQYISNLDLKSILNLNFELNFYYKSQKICPIIELAKPEDAKEIINIFKELYKGEYPYKQMEDEDSVKEMIIHPNYKWFLFKLPLNEITGCFGADLNFDEKRAFLHGFVIKKQYQKTIDIFKAFIASIIYLWRKYGDKIFIWYGEMRTNESISQFFTSLVGMKPIAFFPNKDIFKDNELESDILHVIFSKNVLNRNRYKAKPIIIRQVLNCYNYSNKRYKLGLPIIENPTINLNQNKIKDLEALIKTKIKVDKFDFKNIKFFIKSNSSYFKFFLNPYSKNIEKISYNIADLEELYIFIEKLKQIIKDMDINYCECFVSSYKSDQQKIFYNAGFEPRGYIPSWKYNKRNNNFEDRIVFNWYKGNIDNQIKLIPESKELLEILDFFVEELINLPSKSV